jgi:hypothetical protein
MFKTRRFYFMNKTTPLIYKGKRKRRFCVKASKQAVTTTVYLSDVTVVTTVDDNGNVETTQEPP